MRAAYSIVTKAHTTHRCNGTIGLVWILVSSRLLPMTAVPRRTPRPDSRRPVLPVVARVSTVLTPVGVLVSWLPRAQQGQRG